MVTSEVFNSNTVHAAHVEVQIVSFFERPFTMRALEECLGQVLEQVSDDELARRSRFAGGTLDDTLWVLRQVLDEVGIVGFSLDFTEQTQKLIIALLQVLVLMVGQRVVGFEDERAEGAVVRRTCVVLQLVRLQLVFNQNLVSAGAVVGVELILRYRANHTYCALKAVLPIAMHMCVYIALVVRARSERTTSHLAGELVVTLVGVLDVLAKIVDVMEDFGALATLDGRATLLHNEI